MPYQYKRESLRDDEINRVINAYETFDGKFVVRTLLDTGPRVSELANLKKTSSGRSAALLSMVKEVPAGKNGRIILIILVPGIGNELLSVTGGLPADFLTIKGENGAMYLPETCC
jgi:hypothetical protein